MTKPSNYGYAGLVITLPKLWQEFDKQLSEELIEYDQQAQYVVKTLTDITNAIYELGSLLRDDNKSQVRLYDRPSNNEQYYRYSGIRSFIRGKIGSLMNYVLVIGETALELLETMYVHASRLNRDKPDELAYQLSYAINKGVEE